MKLVFEIKFTKRLAVACFRFALMLTMPSREGIGRSLHDTAKQHIRTFAVMSSCVCTSMVLKLHSELHLTAFA